MCGKDYPSAYLDGYADFYYERYKVTEGVLIPRPDTELAVEAALMLCGALAQPMGEVASLTPSITSKSISLADLCTGTGCLGISTANALIKAGRHCRLMLVDISDIALACCRENVSVCKTDVKVMKADILTEDLPGDEKFDVITSNPPYISDMEMDELPHSVLYEPEIALRGGADGLLFYSRLCRIGTDRLADGGALVVEHGYLQQDDVMEIFAEFGYTDIRGLKDYGGNPRVVTGIWRGDHHAG